MATFALFSWPLIAMALIFVLGRMKGVIWCILVPALLLPERVVYDLPALPPYDKEMSIVLGLLLGLFAVKFRKGTYVPPEIANPKIKKWLYGLSGLLVLSAFLTVFSNGERLVFGPTVLPGLGIRDLISMVFQTLMFLGIYFIAQRHLSTPEAHTQLLRAFVLVGLVYTLPILFEIRMSPQLHRWTYGLFQHSWNQHVRGGHFRPIVFMPHGLWIGILLTTCVMSAFILLKNKVKAGQPRAQYFLIGLWFMGVLLISRNFGASAIALVLVPVLWFLRYRAQILIAMVIMILFLVHPALRQTELVTLEGVAERVGQIAPERQRSFEFRLENEASMLERAAEKPLAGWGLWARWRVYDPVTGEDTTTADGRWIIMLGERGWIGYIAYFGLLTLPTLLLLRTARRRELTQATAGLGLIMSAVIVYQIPNDTIGPLVLIVAGALSGFVLHKGQEEAGLEVDTGPPHNRYTRFPGHTAVRTPREGATPHTRSRPAASIKQPLSS